VQEANRIALLIDCDNVSHNAIEGVLEELAKHGTVNVRHAHGDWNNPSLSGWAEKLHPHAIRPMQQFAYTRGKNATESPRVYRRLHFLRGWSYDKINEICTGSPGTGCSDGAGAPGGAYLPDRYLDFPCSISSSKSASVLSPTTSFTA